MMPENALVYVIGMPCVQAVKIGWTSDIATRLAAFQTGSPFPLSVLWQQEVPNAPAVEKALHRQFSSKRVRGEWFDLGPDAARMVREACAEVIATLPSLQDEDADFPDYRPGIDYDPHVLAIPELVWRDAGRWHDSLTGRPGYVTAGELAGHIRAFTDPEGQGALWSKLSDSRTCRLILEAYTGHVASAPEVMQVKGDCIPVGLIGGIWAGLKQQAAWQPRLAPHCDVPVEAAEAEAARLSARVAEMRRERSKQPA